MYIYINFSDSTIISRHVTRISRTKSEGDVTITTVHILGTGSCGTEHGATGTVYSFEFAQSYFRPTEI